MRSVSSLPSSSGARLAPCVVKCAVTTVQTTGMRGSVTLRVSCATKAAVKTNAAKNVAGFITIPQLLPTLGTHDASAPPLWPASRPGRRGKYIGKPRRRPPESFSYLPECRPRKDQYRHSYGDTHHCWKPA